jgi:hypothetical protein
VNACAIFGRGRALKLSRGLYPTALSVTITEANLCRELAAADKRGRSRLVSAFVSIFFVICSVAPLGLKPRAALPRQDRGPQRERSVTKQRLRDQHRGPCQREFHTPV